MCADDATLVALFVLEHATTLLVSGLLAVELELGIIEVLLKERTLDRVARNDGILFGLNLGRCDLVASDRAQLSNVIVALVLGIAILLRSARVRCDEREHLV